MAKYTKSSDNAGGNPGGVVRAMNGVTARGDQFANSLSVYAQRAKDFAGNISGPISVTDGANEFATNLLRNKARAYELSNSLLLKQENSAMSLAEIDAEMRGESNRLQGDIEQKKMDVKNAENTQDFLGVYSDIMSINKGINMMAKNISHAIGDETTMPDSKDVTDRYNQMRIAEENRLGRQLTLEEKRGIYGQSYDQNVKLHPTGVFRAIMEFTGEVDPSLKEARKIELTNATMRGLAMRNAITPDMANDVRDMVAASIGRQRKSIDGTISQLDNSNLPWFIDYASNMVSLAFGDSASPGPIGNTMRSLGITTPFRDGSR